MQWRFKKERNTKDNYILKDDELNLVSGGVLLEDWDKTLLIIGICFLPLILLAGYVKIASIINSKNIDKQD